MKFFFIFILIILTLISFKSYTNSREDINKYLNNELQDFELNKEIQNVSNLAFKNHRGEEIKFTDFKGKILLVNFWATWCVPCIKEMPSLDRLKSKFDKDFDVLAISIDRDGIEKVSNFFKENQISNLEKFFDNKNFLAKEMDLFGVPTSFFLNKKGEIIGSYQGDMEWDNDTVINFIKYLIKI